MRRSASFMLLLSLAVLWGCASTVLVSVPPRMDLKNYGTVGIVEFASNSGHAIDLQATRQFQQQIQAAQPGTRFIELGSRETVLAAINGKQLDAQGVRKLGEKYGVSAVFLGDIAYSEPKTDVQLKDLSRLEGAVRTEIKADIASRLVETSTGASVWSNSAWVKRQIGRLSVSAEQGVSGGMSNSDSREEMVPALVYQLTHDFRSSSVRQAAK
jgi:hypothetical protein